MSETNTNTPGNNEAPKGETQAGSTEPILGKFKTQDDLKAGYTNLEKEFTKSQQELAELRKKIPAEQPKADKTADQSKGPNFDPRTLDEIITGNLSDHTKSLLLSLGMEQGKVDALVSERTEYNNYKNAKVNTTVQEHFKDVGTFNLNDVMLEIAKTSNQEKIEAIGKIVASGDLEVLRPYITNYLKAKLPEGQTGNGSPQALPFANRTEYVKAIRDSRFDSDREYRQAVQTKVNQIPQDVINRWIRNKD
jgi:hypothetical protein